METDKLDAWEQALIQRMNINHDRYPTDTAKIAYAESRLTIGKRASILMMPYRRDGICTISTFAEYRHILRHVCGNPFEAEDARTYLRDTLKQGSGSFMEYYQLFCQKKDRSGMEEASLIDCFKRNVSYAVQLLGEFIDSQLVFGGEFGVLHLSWDEEWYLGEKATRRGRDAMEALQEL